VADGVVFPQVTEVVDEIVVLTTTESSMCRVADGVVFPQITEVVDKIVVLTTTEGSMCQMADAVAVMLHHLVLRI
jgi:hypothetical protein